MLDLIIEYDQKLFVWLNNLGNEYFDWFWMLLTNKLFNFLVYSIALIYLFKKTKTKSFISMILFLLILILISDQTSNLFKNYFERLRPCHDEQIFNSMRLVKNSCGGLYSFFSAPEGPVRLFLGERCLVWRKAPLVIEAINLAAPAAIGNAIVFSFFRCCVVAVQNPPI